jgi:hypothetical protein
MVSPGESPEALSGTQALRIPTALRARLTTVKLEWVDFQVMRRTHSSLMRELGVDPKVVADSMGHDVNVNLNVYTQTPLESRVQAVETLGSAFVN